MFDTDLEPNIEEELPEIPAEYQELFRQVIQQELVDTEQNRSDGDTLAYLRRRRDDFKRGGFIRLDGRPGAMTLSPRAVYEQALPELAKSSLGEPDEAAERRQTLIKVGALVIAALVFFLFVSRLESRRDAAQNAARAETPAVDVAGPGTPAPTPPLPEISGADDSLQTIGGLGGALTIGRPSALEIHFGQTEETIALAIDPSKPTPKGELRYNETTMLSDNPVAVWLFGTVLNYAIGVPDSLVRNLAPGDRLTLSTDTGAALRFVVLETGQGANYETGRLLSQNRLGLTLFALPAAAEDDVAFAIAGYDIATEEEQAQPALEVGDAISLAGGGELQLLAAGYGQQPDGSLGLVVSGTMTTLGGGQTVMLSLAAGGEQTTAVPLAPDAGGAWQAAFSLPAAVAGRPLLAEFRSLPGHLFPGGGPAVVGLGAVPHLVDRLQATIDSAWWDGEQGLISLALTVHNPGHGAVYLDDGFIQIPLTEGGDAYEMSPRVLPRLPLLIEAGETLGLVVTFPWHASTVRLQIGADLWQLAAPAAE